MKLLIALIFAGLLSAQEWKNVFNGKNLDGWETRGDCIWTVLKDGTLIGQRPHPAGDPFKNWPLPQEQFRNWMNEQSWLYTTADFDQFDLQLQYWIPPGGNSGVSIRDTSRARYTFGPDHDSNKTPAHIGYEIQIIAGDHEKYPSGSVYLFAPAKTGVQRLDEWNTMEIESRHDLIRVRINGQVVAESAGDPNRSKTGPIGLQLHDRFSWAMFRNIKIRQKD